jgi:GR25 family glycosyltransferase involved in LPS biosynthesis
MSDMTVVQLKDMCRKKGISGYSRKKKAELVKLCAKPIKTVKRKAYSYAGKRSNPLNKFFNKIYIINLDDKQDRFNKVTKQFVRNGVKYERFPAVDGRCDKKKRGACTKKRKEMAKRYKVKIAPKMETAAASLVIGTRELLKDAIKNGYDHVLICEDDIVFGRNMSARFAEGIKELNAEVPDWDLLYLGSGGQSGVRGISQHKTSKNKHKTSLSIIDKNLYNWYVAHKDDLRVPCDEEECETISKRLTIPERAGGGWCYAVSLKGAKKIVRRFAHVDDHADQTIPNMSVDGKLVTVSFDPPIVWHEAGAFRPDSTIPWDW